MMGEAKIYSGKFIQTHTHKKKIRVQKASLAKDS